MRLKGSVTVFMSIVLSALIAFCGIMVDVSRLRAGRKHAQSAVQMSVQSALTQFHAPLKEHYGLMAVGQEQEEIESLIFDMLEKNLAVENRYMPGFTDLYGFKVENVTVEPFFNLSEYYVLEQQITQFMKYRAPVNTIGNFIQKLQSLNTFMAQSGLINKKMDLEKKLQKIREEQVYLSLLLSERINGLVTEGKAHPDIENRLALISTQRQQIHQLEVSGSQLETIWNQMPVLIQCINEIQEGIGDLEEEISELETKKAPYEREYSRLNHEKSKTERDISGIQAEIQVLDKKISKEEEKEHPNQSLISSIQKERDTLNKKLSDYKNRLSSLKSDSSRVSDKISQYTRMILSKKSEISDKQEAIHTSREALENKVKECLLNLQKIYHQSDSICKNISAMNNLITKYINYHNHVVYLLDSVRKGAETIRRLTEDINDEIKKQSQKSDSSFLVRIKTDMKKLILNTDPAVILNIQTEVESNLMYLSDLLSKLVTAENRMDEINYSIKVFSAKTEDIPETLKYIDREFFGNLIDETIRYLETDADRVINNYKQPRYSVEPVINKKEKNEFAKWCNDTFNEENLTDTGKDKGYEKKLKKNIEDSNESNKEDLKTYNGDDLKISDMELEKLFSKLPSFRDENGDYINVKNSEPMETLKPKESLLPDEEDRTADIEESYGNDLNRNGNLASKIEEVLADSSKALLNSLYVNEFIVSAFNNANSDKVDTPGINLTNTTKETFFERAEAEYVIFGAKKEKTNANLAQASIFGIRMGMNLIHVYTNPDKTTAALTISTTIVGWSAFLVPIVKNLILLGWAAGESWYDMNDINEGKPVPIYKTKDSWRLDLKSLFTGIAGEFIDDTADWLKESKDDLIDDGEKALRSMVGEMVSSMLHEAFLPAEEMVRELEDAVDNTAEPSLVNLNLPDDFSCLEDLKDWILEAAQKQFQSIKDEAVNWSMLKLDEYKKKMTDKLTEFIFDSAAYKKLLSSLKDGIDDLIDSGTIQLADAVKELGNQIEDTGMKNKLLGTIASFDYIDYLRLLLFVVPQKTKLLRSADLMQLNMSKTLDNGDFMMSNYSSFLIVEAEISLRYLFLPPNVAKGDRGRIMIRWGYGY